ncbi:nucleic acid-binding protein, partial [Trichodelitschia bisporula]
PRRTLHATATLTSTPPDTLPPTHLILRVLGAAGNNLFKAETVDKKPLLVELPRAFRGTVWIKRGGYVVVDTAAMEGRENKIGGEIVNVVREVKGWRRMGYWPKEFAEEKRSYGDDSSDEEESNVGKMPPSESSEE